MLRFQKRLNSGVAATTALLNLILEIVSCCDGSPMNLPFVFGERW